MDTELHSTRHTANSFIVPREIREEDGRPKYVQIYMQLKKELRFGGYSAGERFFSIRTLMDAYGLNMKTVRSAIQLLANDGLVVNRPAAGLYVTSPEGRCVGGGMGNLWFCQLGQEKNHPYYNAILTALQARADREGLNVVLNRNSDLASFPAWFKPETGDGLVVTGELDPAFVRFLRGMSNGRFVVVGNYDLPDDVPNVRHNIFAVVQRAVTLTATAGRRRLGVLAGPQERLVTREIMKGVHAVVRTGSIEYVGGVFDVSEDGYAGMEKLRDAAIDCVLVTEPGYFSLCRYVFEQQMKCPDALYIIRFGDNLKVNGYDDIASLYTRSNPDAIAKAALDILFYGGEPVVELAEHVVCCHPETVA